MTKKVYTYEPAFMDDITGDLASITATIGDMTEDLEDHEHVMQVLDSIWERLVSSTLMQIDDD